MTGSNEVLLVRHGETDDNAAGRFQGRSDTPLNVRGREQSRALARELTAEGVRVLYSSPLRRARETAQIVADALGLPIVDDERLVEVDTGAWTGRLVADVVADDPAAYRRWRAADPTFRFPHGESVAEQAARVADALADVSAGPLPALVVAHGGTIRAVDGVERPPGGTVANCALLRLPAPRPRP